MFHKVSYLTLIVAPCRAYIRSAHYCHVADGFAHDQDHTELSHAPAGLEVRPEAQDADHDTRDDHGVVLQTLEPGPEAVHLAGHPTPRARQRCGAGASCHARRANSPVRPRPVTHDSRTIRGRGTSRSELHATDQPDGRVEGTDAHFERAEDAHLRDLFAADPQRGEQLHVEVDGPLPRLLEEPRSPTRPCGCCVALAERAGLRERIDAMFARREDQRHRGPGRAARRAARAPRRAHRRRRRRRRARRCTRCSTRWRASRDARALRDAHRATRASASATSSTSASAARTSGRRWPTRR